MTLQEEVTLVRAENQLLKEQLAQALARIELLEAELEQIKSAPPPFAKSATPKRDKADKPPRRKRAPQHNSARPREIPTKIVQHTLDDCACPDCGYPLRTPQLAHRRQVIELPPPPPVEITEHQVFKSWCARCGRWHYAPLDLSGHVVGQGRMGVRIASLIAYLRTTLRLPVEQIQQYLQMDLTVHQFVISSGEIVELMHRLTQAPPIKRAIQALYEQVRSSEVVHGDETGWREEGQNGYIWSFSTPQGERLYEYDQSRGGAVARRILSPQFNGALGTDFYCGYNEYTGVHQRCWAHMLRDLHNLKSKHPTDEEVQGWAKGVQALYEGAQQLLQLQHELGPPSHDEAPEKRRKRERERAYEQLVEQARQLGLKYARYPRASPHPCTTLANRLLRHQDELFQFVLVPGLSADNNLAERSIRPVVVMRKISGGTQSPKGSTTRMMLTSLFGTWRAKGLNPFLECLALLTQTPLPSVPLI